MNVAGVELRGNKLRVNPSIDVNETTAIVLDAKLRKQKTGVVLVGGGSPKNFTLQTEPQIQEVLRIKEAGHDYFLQFTDARPDTGGLSGATPSEAVSWGKIDPNQLPMPWFATPTPPSPCPCWPTTRWRAEDSASSSACTTAGPRSSSG